MDKTELRTRTTKTFFVELVAVIILLVGLACVFAGPLYVIKINGEKVGFGLIDLFNDSVLGVAVNVCLVSFGFALPLLGAVLIILSGKHRTLLIASVIVLFAAALANVILAVVVAKMDGVKSVEFCGYLSAICCFVVASVSFLAISAKEQYSIYDIVETGMLVAMAVGLNIIRIFRMPTGGSANFQMLPLFILAIRRGPVKGFIGAGVVYGLITCLTDGYGFATYPFDYLLGFGSAAVLGFFSNQIFGKEQTSYNLKGELFIVLGCIISTCVRFVASTASSMIIYDYDFQAAAIYNVGYVFASGGLAMAALMLLYGPLAMINAKFPRRAL